MIGIDLGTTNSLVALLDGDKPRVLSNEFGEELTPLAVAIAEDGTILVGRAAKDRLIIAPDSGVAFFKRDMGTSTTYRFGGRRWTPVECSALILGEMKRIAETHLGKEIDNAVITVPAYFRDQQRQATVNAASIAGLKVNRLLNEPTAAALAYGYRAPEELNTLLVFDLGGGTFDVTVLEVFDGVVEVKASAGESRLGGEDYTDALIQWIAREFHWEPTAADSLRWRAEIEKTKRALTSATTTTVMIDGRPAPISRADFIEATKSLTSRLGNVVRDALRDARLTAKQLDGVLLVGGASRMPAVIDQVQADLGISARSDLDPDRVVALGAAIQQGLCDGNAAVSDLILTDVCPHSLGVEVAKALVPGHMEPGFFDPILDRNTTVPVSRSRTYSPIYRDQDQVLLKVYQGESRLTKENHLIGQVRVDGLRGEPGDDGSKAFDVRFSYDMNGILEVDVEVLGSGRKVTAVFEQRPGTMTQEQIAEALRRLRPLKVHPRESPPHRARMERANLLFTKLIGFDRDRLTLMIDRFHGALIAQDPTLIAQAAAELDEFMYPFFDHD